MWRWTMVLLGACEPVAPKPVGEAAVDTDTDTHICDFSVPCLHIKGQDWLSDIDEQGETLTVSGSGTAPQRYAGCQQCLSVAAQISGGLEGMSR